MINIYYLCCVEPFLFEFWRICSLVIKYTFKYLLSFILKYCQTIFSPTTRDLKCFLVDRITHYIVLHVFMLCIFAFVFVYTPAHIHVNIFYSWQDSARITLLCAPYISSCHLLCIVYLYSCICVFVFVYMWICIFLLDRMLQGSHTTIHCSLCAQKCDIFLVKCNKCFFLHMRHWTHQSLTYIIR